MLCFEEYDYNSNANKLLNTLGVVCTEYFYYKRSSIIKLKMYLITKQNPTYEHHDIDTNY